MKVVKRWKKYFNVIEEKGVDCGVKFNVKLVFGVMIIRGCVFVGVKGVVWGFVKDMVYISYGFVGCGYYFWVGCCNYYNGVIGVDIFGIM